MERGRRSAIAVLGLSDLRTRIPSASGVSGPAAQGLPIAGGRRGVAFRKAGQAHLVAASGGRVHLRTPGGQDRVLLERASTPVVGGDRILYVSASRTVETASLTGTDVRSVAGAGPGGSITNLDLLDDSTLVVTVT